MKALRSLLLLSLLMFVCAASVTAQTNITIQNPSFETHGGFTNSGSAGSWNCGPVPNWTLNSGGPCFGSFQPSASFYPSVPDGTVIAFCNNCSASQGTGVSVLGNQTYTLSAYVGGRGDTGTWTISLYAGMTLLASASGPNSSIAAGTFQKQSVSYTSPASPPTGILTVQLTAGGDYDDWDLVSLSYVPVGHQAVLTWTDSQNPSGTQYNVYRSAGPSCTSFIRLNGNPVSALTYTDATIVSGQSYCFEVRAIIGTGESIAGDNLFLVVQ